MNNLDPIEVEFYVDFIVADYIPFNYNGRNYSIRSPSKENKIVANEVFLDYYYKAIAEGVLDSDTIHSILLNYGIWNKDKEILVEKMNKEIEDMKVMVFENYLNRFTRKNIKQAIKDTKDYLGKLSLEKHMFDSLGAEFIGNYAKYQTLLGFSIYNAKGKPLWKSFKCFGLPNDMNDIINEKLNRYKIEPENYRELACSDYWKSIWNIRKGNGLFGRSVINFTDHQKTNCCLVNYV